MKDLLKESILDLKKADGYIYITDEGKKIDLQEAAARGISVTPVNPRHEVLKKLEAAGLFLTDNKFLDELNELIAALNGKKTSKPPKKRKSFTESQKSKILEEWKKVEALGSKTKAEFAREIGIGYQTLMTWLRS